MAEQLHLREAPVGLVVEVIQLLVNPAQLQVAVMMMVPTSGSVGQQQLLDPLQLELADALLYLPEHPP